MAYYNQSHGLRVNVLSASGEMVLEVSAGPGCLDIDHSNIPRIRRMP
jgi:hypothetical protein